MSQSFGNNAFNATVHDVLARYFSQQVSPEQAQNFVSRLPEQWPQSNQIEQTLQNAGMSSSDLRSHLVNALNSLHPSNPNRMQQQNQPQQNNWNQNQPNNWGPQNQPQQNNWNQNQPNNWNQPQQNNWNQTQPQQGGWNQNPQGNWNQPQQPGWGQPNNWNQPGYNNYGGPNYGGGYNNYGNPNYGGGYNNYGPGNYGHFYNYGSPGVVMAEDWMMLDTMFASQPGFMPGMGFGGGNLVFDEMMMGGMGMNMGMGMNPMQQMTEVNYDMREMNDLAHGNVFGAIVDEEKKDILEDIGL